MQNAILLIKGCFLLFFFSCAYHQEYKTVSLPKHKSEIRVLTLNIGHARGSAVHQIFVNKNKIRNNLTSIASMLRKHNVNVAAFQEIDGDSFWSGNTDHMMVLSEESGFKHIFRGTHVRGPGLDYGTGVLSQYPFVNTHSSSFPPTPPLPQKGFVVIDIEHPKVQEGIRFISLHLDFAFAGIRQKQLQEISKIIEHDSKKVIVMGDFNMSWTPELQEFCQRHHLKAFQPNQKLPTFPKTNMRLDWILIPENFHFSHYRVLPDHVSDHQAVIASIAIP